MKILLVDDDRSTRYLIGRTLARRFGCEVTEAGDGRQALDALRQGSYRLAILDVQMPTMDGLETLRALRDSPEYASLPVVMLTGERDETIIREILELGVLEYMAKPLNMGRLNERLRRILRSIVSIRDGAEDEPGWFSQALRNTDAPLLVVEGRTPFRLCFSETFGAHRPVIASESGVAGMRDLVTGNPGVVFVGADLGVLSEPLLLRRIRSSPAFCRIPLVALVDDEEEADRRLVDYDGTLTRTLAPETLLKRMADLIRLGARSGWDAAELPPGFRATVLLVSEQIFGMALAADAMLCDLPVVGSAERVRVAGVSRLPPGGEVRLEVVCDIATARRAAANLFGVDARLVRDEHIDQVAVQVFDMLRARLAGIYPDLDGAAVEPPAVSRNAHWAPRSAARAGVALCFQTPAREHEFWLEIEPVRT